MIPTSGCNDGHVWGVLWELDMEHMDTLDQQEGVPHVYNKKQVMVECENGTKHEAVTYFLIKPDEEDKRPSGVYKDVIVRGAEEHHLPPDYIQKLRQVEDNGYRGNVSVTVDLRQISKIPD